MVRHECWLLVMVAVTATARGQILDVKEIESAPTIGQRIGLTGKSARLLTQAWVREDAKAAIGQAKTFRDAGNADYRGHAIQYLAELELQNDRKLATKTAVRAMKELGQKPTQLAQFIKRALFANPTINEYQIGLMALVPVVPGEPKNPVVRIAYLRALEGCGKVREAVLANKRIVEDLGHDKSALYELAHTICDMKNGRALAPFANKALKRIMGDDEVQPEGYRKLQYRVLKLMGLDRPAQELGEKILGRISGPDLNNWLWYMMVNRPDAGRYPGLALIGARRMMKLSDPAYNEYDTIALALFRNGLVDEAIEYQEKAIANGGAGDPDYVRRMKMYREAQESRRKKKPAPPRKGGAKKRAR